ncbi:MAG: nucleotide exchange factor GrpE [Cyanobacteria bacterium J06638_7]
MSGESAVGPESSAGAELQPPLPQTAASDPGGREDGQVAAVAEAGGEPAPVAEAAAADPGQGAAQLEARLAELMAEHENLNSQYMRLAADFDNFRKRQSRDQDDLRLQITCSTLSEILPVVDNFERARQQLTPQDEEALKLHRSYQGLYKQLVEVFKQLGVSPMRVEGEPFDPGLHEAVLREESLEHPEDVVIAEVQRGYQLQGRVLRHALVKVSSGPGPAAPAGGGDAPATAAPLSDGEARVPASDT